MPGTSRQHLSQDQAVRLAFRSHAALSLKSVLNHRPMMTPATAVEAASSSQPIPTAREARERPQVDQ